MTGPDVYVLIIIALILTIFLVKIYRLSQSGVKVNKWGRKKKGLQWLVERAIFPLVLLILYEIILYACHWPYHLFGQEMLLSPAMLRMARPLGMLGLAGATILLFFTLQSFGDSYRLGVDHESPGDLVVHGVFAFSRNPVYLGLDIIFVSLFLFYGSLFFLSMMLGAGLAMHIMIINEEKALRKNFADQYVVYCQQVPRYFSIKSLMTRWSLS